jgi:hypothetical protein
MTPDDLETALQRAGSRRQQATPQIGDVTANVLDEIRRRGTAPDDATAWRWATSAAVAVALVGLAVAAPSWDRLENPLSDLADFVPAVQR